MKGLFTFLATGFAVITFSVGTFWYYGYTNTPFFDVATMQRQLLAAILLALLAILVVLTRIMLLISGRVTAENTERSKAGGAEIIKQFETRAP